MRPALARMRMAVEVAEAWAAAAEATVGSVFAVAWAVAAASEVNVA